MSTRRAAENSQIITKSNSRAHNPRSLSFRASCHVMTHHNDFQERCKTSATETTHLLSNRTDAMRVPASSGRILMGSPGGRWEHAGAHVYCGRLAWMSSGRDGRTSPAPKLRKIDIGELHPSPADPMANRSKSSPSSPAPVTLRLLTSTLRPTTHDGVNVRHCLGTPPNPLVCAEARWDWRRRRHCQSILSKTQIINCTVLLNERTNLLHHTTPKVASPESQGS